MNRNMAFSNRIIEDRFDIKKQRMHWWRIRTVKSMIDNRQPKRPKCFNSKGCKKFRLEKDYLQEVKWQNKVLLKKMLSIDIAGENHHPDRMQLPKCPSAYSLNWEYRLRELTWVTSENQRLLDRLKKTGSCYSTVKWESSNLKKNYWL